MKRKIEEEITTNHRCLSPTFMSPDLPHHHTYRSAYTAVPCFYASEGVHLVAFSYQTSLLPIL
ncbi:MAG: hypothetical protein MSH43_00600 [Bacteroidales bacterium]|nr:hypothetical protein [Bacteroidales bacterium]